MKILRWLTGPCLVVAQLLVGPHTVCLADEAQRADVLETSEVVGPPGAQPVPLDTESDCLIAPWRGLQAYYDFRLATGSVVKDWSGHGKPIDLEISNVDSVRRSSGALQLLRETDVESTSPATKITESVRRSGEFAIEVWLRPAQVEQAGPSRIVTLSRDSSARNFTLGQDNDRYDVRLRTSRTNENGIPSVKSPGNVLTTDLTHVVYTRNRAGRATLYVNGEQNRQKHVPGSMTNWTESFRLRLGNESGLGRPWLGTYYLVAIYNRDVPAEEVEQNFSAGPTGRAAPQRSVSEVFDEKSLGFETQIAPLLARHCLECHAAHMPAGGLNLMHRDEALAGGDSGRAIVGGNSADSLLWELIESDEMPQDRPALSPEEKRAIRDWIDTGAVWSIEQIDPAVYALTHGSESTWLQRLTIAEYVETVKSAVGLDVETEARELLPPDLRADGFSNTSYNLRVDLEHVQAYAKLAKLIVSRLDLEEFASQFSPSRETSDKNLRNLIFSMGKWLLRGPLDERELLAYLKLTSDVIELDGEFRDVIQTLVESMLQSPRFLYRMENQRGDGSAWPVSHYELASRLSYILWGGPPDRELLRSVEAGDFYDCQKIEAQVDRMLANPRTAAWSERFAQEWLDLDRLDHLRPNRDRFPQWDAALAEDMKAESIAFFRDVVWIQGRPLVELLNAQVTFLTPRLAKHYGLQPQAADNDRYDLNSISSRGGLLTQGSVLTLGGDEASMVTRGLFVLHELLRGVVKDPPPCVDVTPVPTKPGITQRAIAEARIEDASCGGCHAKFEPLAFGLEPFDGLGTYQVEDEHGNRLRDDGEITIPGESQRVRYQTASELMDVLAQSRRVSESLTWKVTQFALGRPLTALDARSVEKIHRKSEKAGGTYANILRAIVMSDLVQSIRTEDFQ